MSVTYVKKATGLFDYIGELFEDPTVIDEDADELSGANQLGISA